MKAIDAVIGHYVANERQFIDIPEWGIDGKPMRVRWKLLTFEEQKTLLAREREYVEILVEKALDENGQTLFDKADVPKLKRAADPAIVTRIVNAMLRLTVLNTEDIEEARKN
jgi:hypothetical protein